MATPVARLGRSRLPEMLANAGDLEDPEEGGSGVSEGVLVLCEPHVGAVEDPYYQPKCFPVADRGPTR